MVLGSFARVRRDAEPADEAILSERMRQGDRVAHDALVTRYWKRAVGYADALLGDRDLASDVGQEAFARLWHYGHRLEPGRLVRPWLFRTIRNLCVDQHRSRRVMARWVTQQDQSSRPGPPTPVEELENLEIRTAIELAVRSLPPRRRQVFTLFHLRKLSYREIAAIMGIRPRSIANHLQAAVADLREALKDFFPGAGPQTTAQ